MNDIKSLRLVLDKIKLNKTKDIMSIIYNLKQRTTAISRKNKLRHFFTLYKEGMSVLDVGVSREDSRDLPNRNYFLKHFPFSGELYTGLGVQDLSNMEQIFSDKKFIQYPGKKIPFKNREFDWTFSNAVIEHVGFEDDQLEFLNEMLRVSNNVFLLHPTNISQLSLILTYLFYIGIILFFIGGLQNTGMEEQKIVYIFFHIVD